MAWSSIASFSVQITNPQRETLPPLSATDEIPPTPVCGTVHNWWQVPD